jgi:hypothetical protein
MRRPTREPATAALLLLLLPGAASCGGAAEDPTSAAPASASATAVSPAPSPRAKISTPPSTAGSLSIRSFPRPAELGDDWSYAVDPGDVEEGYAGNGTPALAREPGEVLRTVLPFGCARGPRLDAPRKVLEVDYRSPYGKVVALRLRFADPTAASAFFAARTTGLRRCLDRSPSPAIGPLVRRLTLLDERTVSSDRTPASDPWTELAGTAGSLVTLVAIQGPTDRIDDREARRLAGVFTG